MTEYSVTSIRYQLGEGLPFEERTRMAERFVAGLKMGQQVMLMAEPDNPVDSNAIAAYIDYERIGYIDKEEVFDIHPLLDQNHQCDAVVVRKDSHITFFVSIPDEEKKTVQKTGQRRILPDSPLGDDVRMPFTKDENQLQLIASRLAGITANKANIGEILHLTELYVPLLKTSLCHEEALWMNRILKKLGKLQTLCSEENADEASKLDELIKKVRACVGDMHRTGEHWPERVFTDHLDRLRKDKTVNVHLYKKYCNTFLDGKTFSEAKKSLVAKEYMRLEGWLKSMKWSEMRYPDKLQAMGLKVNYLGLSRQELYELYSVLLILEQLKQQVDEKTIKRQEILEKLTPIFYDNEEDAALFLDDIQGKKPKEITDLVNLLVEKRMISDMRKNRDLWSVLYDYGYYPRTESNWNAQVK